MKCEPEEKHLCYYPIYIKCNIGFCVAILKNHHVSSIFVIDLDQAYGWIFYRIYKKFLDQF